MEIETSHVESLIDRLLTLRGIKPTANYDPTKRTIEFIAENCKFELVPVGNSGITLLRRNPDNGGRTHVGFKIDLNISFGVNHFTRGSGRVLLANILRKIASRHDEARLVILDVALPMLNEYGVPTIDL